MLSILRNHQKGCVIAQLIVALKKVFTFTTEFSEKTSLKTKVDWKGFEITSLKTKKWSLEMG